MKIRLLLLAFLAISAQLVGASVKPRALATELGDSLGIYAYKFEASLAPDQVLVVRASQRKGAAHAIQTETIIRSPDALASYVVSLVDSGSFVSKQFGSYILRSPAISRGLEKTQLIQREEGGDRVFFLFQDLEAPREESEFIWKAEVEPYADVKLRWPKLPTISKGNGFTYQTVIPGS
jgi:hypothetical protein